MRKLHSKAHAIRLHLPCRGRWFVTHGGDTLNVNQHMTVRAQWFGIDLMKVGGPGRRTLCRTTANTADDFYSWGDPVLSPVAGRVKEIVNDIRDNKLGTMNPKNLAGNHVIIAAASGYVFLAHMIKGSIKVKPGQRVKVGLEIGKCGNSGNSSAPHIHMHVQDSPTLNRGQGRNMIFKGINVELTGKMFKNVDWPLIRGLFVWNNEYALQQARA